MPWLQSNIDRFLHFMHIRNVYLLLQLRQLVYAVQCVQQYNKIDIKFLYVCLSVKCSWFISILYYYLNTEICVCYMTLFHALLPYYYMHAIGWYIWSDAQAYVSIEQMTCILLSIFNSYAFNTHMSKNGILLNIDM